MKVISEKLAFSQRLVEALQAANVEARSPTVFSREFNRRYQGKSVSIHATRKWLTGEAIPAQDKIQLLAMWLGVSAEWLRFGGKESGASQAAKQVQALYNSPDFELLHQFNKLSNEHQLVAREVILTLVRLEGKA